MPSHTIYSRDSIHAWYVMPKVVSLHAWPQNLEAFSHMREQAKKDKMWSVLSPKDFNFCSPHFFYHPSPSTLTVGVGLVDREFAEICEHTLFTCQSRWIEKLTYRSTGDQCSYNKLATLVSPDTQTLGTNVASLLWLHWSPVLLYVYFSI